MFSYKKSVKAFLSCSIVLIAAHSATAHAMEDNQLIKQEMIKGTITLTFSLATIYASHKLSTYLTTPRKEAIQVINTPYTFKDLAGKIPEDVRHFAEFIKNPKRFNNGAMRPKGLLLTGEPGTGKTAIARALAGETKSAFFQIAGSEFQKDKYVGTGAAEIRKLFDAADKSTELGLFDRILSRDRKPAIIFIDEIDAIPSRYNESSVNSDLVNQLLTCMDGFKQDTNISVVAATNFDEHVDEALKRPGRFDYIVKVPLPDREDRLEIVKHYSQRYTLNEKVDIETIADDTQGFSPAEIKQILNDAAICAVTESKDNDTSIHEKHISAAMRKFNKTRKKDLDKLTYFS